MIYFDVQSQRCHLCFSFPESSGASAHMNGACDLRISADPTAVSRSYLKVVHPAGHPEGRREGPRVPQAVRPVPQAVLLAPRSVLLGASASLRDSAAAVAFGRDTRPLTITVTRVKHARGWIHCGNTMELFLCDTSIKHGLLHKRCPRFRLQQKQVHRGFDKTLSPKTWIRSRKHDTASFGKKLQCRFGMGMF